MPPIVASALMMTLEPWPGGARNVTSQVPAIVWCARTSAAMVVQGAGAAWPAGWHRIVAGTPPTKTVRAVAAARPSRVMVMGLVEPVVGTSVTTPTSALIVGLRSA